ncbi:MAG TPA: amino acid permease, partial [Candidatus Bathyarchaeia archaeon]|nr:amino acid permease [Candidatus Bathyarchaeia archaeon]
SLAGSTILRIIASMWFWPLVGMFPIYVALNRAVFSMSFDRMFPEKLAQVSDRTHTPVYATLFNIVICCIWSVLAMSVYGFLVAGANTSFMLSFCYFIWCLAAIALPYKRPELWEKGFKKKILGFPEMTFLGAIAAGGMMWILALSTLGISETGWNVTSLWMFLGVLILVYYINKNTKRGIKVMDIYKEIPPP